jgi:tripartite-type tricarboxylate transporter receptor subunit TctC
MRPQWRWRPEARWRRYEARDWFGIAAPNGTPAAIVESLNREINAGLSDPTMMSALAELHADLVPAPSPML